MRHFIRFMAATLLLGALPGVAFAEERHPAEVIVAVRTLEFELTEKPKYGGHEIPVEELFKFDQASDDVVWVRSYKNNRKVTQIYEIVKDRARTDDKNVVVVPLKWKSMNNDQFPQYNADKHDVGLRITKARDGRWRIRLLSIDTAGQTVDLFFYEKEK